MKACAAMMFALLMGATVLMSGCSTFEKYDEMPLASSTDQQLANEIQHRLTYDVVTTSFTLGVTVQDGIATLKGGVPSEHVRVRALGIARNTPGVKNVDDQLYRYDR
jgi:osmotically-inducible protein OsmY